MRPVLSVILTLVLPSACAFAAELDPHKLELDKSGELIPYGKAAGNAALGRVTYKVIGVGDDWLAIRAHDVDNSSRDDVTFIVRGISTRGMVDDKPWKPEGVWTVSKTEKFKEKTVFTLTRSKK